MVARGRAEIAGIGVACAWIAVTGVGLALSTDSMECDGHLLNMGETMALVRAECGPPGATSHRHVYHKGVHGELDVWVYRRAGSFARVLTFQNGYLTWIESQSQFRD